MENIKLDEQALVMSLRDIILADIQLNYNATSGDDEWSKFDVFVCSVPEAWVGRATAEGLREGWSDYCEGWICLAKSDSWTSPF
ncbi:hypothetical protein E8E11_009046 [Didymella keratinophila]|nr:hypothetical protein E8E11_009046 [Didymella keratinophila]